MSNLFTKSLNTTTHMLGTVSLVSVQNVVVSTAPMSGLEQHSTDELKGVAVQRVSWVHHPVCRGLAIPCPKFFT